MAYTGGPPLPIGTKVLFRLDHYKHGGTREELHVVQQHVGVIVGYDEANKLPGARHASKYMVRTAASIATMPEHCDVHWVNRFGAWNSVVRPVTDLEFEALANGDNHH